MKIDNQGRQAAPTLAEVEEVLRIVTQSLAWYAHGECRGFHEGKPLKSSEAQELARDMLERMDLDRNHPSKHDVPDAYCIGDEPLAWLSGYDAAIKDMTGIGRTQ